MSDDMKATVALMLKGIERYNPNNLPTLEKYVEYQAEENTYDLEANLAVLNLYQFNPEMFKSNVVCTILLKSLTNLPHTDFVLFKCLIPQETLTGDEQVKGIMQTAELLETCQFESFWEEVAKNSDFIAPINGFEDSIRKFACHVVNITYQNIHKSTLRQILGGISEAALKPWVSKYGWKDRGDDMIFIANQEESVKPKNITEKIDFKSVAGVMANCL